MKELKEVLMPVGQKDVDELFRSGGKLPPPVPLGGIAEEKQIENPTGWMDRFELSQEAIDDMQDAEFLIEGGAITSQVTIWVAKPGGGKTSILMHECQGVAALGYGVIYVNMDCGAADVKYWREKANDGGFRLVTPQFNGGAGIDQWIQGLEAMSQEAGDLSNVVIVVDTLKTITDLMSKKVSKRTMKILRGLTARGCSIIAAAHANKHLTPDGELMFEGVGDIESDCDNLIYLEASEKDALGDKTITTVPSNKVRGIFNPRTWKIAEDRTVTALDEAVDVVSERRYAANLEKYATHISVVMEGINEGKHTRTELIEYVHDKGAIGVRAFDRVIKLYCQGKGDPQSYWRNESQSVGNSDYYILLVTL
tara:strand:+ start:345 stop:1445 length:1101 start_codon:yes stop_codon:yes gene_type:complete